MNKADALQTVDELNAQIYPSNGLAVRVNSTPVAPKYTLFSSSVKDMCVRGDAMIEEYLTPHEMFERIQFGSSDIAEALNKKLKHQIAKTFGSFTKREE